MAQRYPTPLQSKNQRRVPSPDYDGDWEVLSSGLYYGDVSGGEFSSFPSIRRCGRGVIQIDSEGEQTRAARFSQSGSVQRVPRAELFCLVWLISIMAPISDVTYVTDNLNLYETFNKGPQASAVSANADLYFKLLHIAIETLINITVRWMPSHLTPTADIPAYVTPHDLKGNAFADKHAGLMAKEVCVPLNVSAPILYYYNLINVF